MPGMVKKAVILLYALGFMGQGCSGLCIATGSRGVVSEDINDDARSVLTL